jgi:energy-coupling factor transporter ATP-binding protein EcfA2
LAHDPLALLLDEPSNSLDFRCALELPDILRKSAQAGAGILMVTHHLPDILPEIDRAILLRQGRLKPRPYGTGPRYAGWRSFRRHRSRATDVDPHPMVRDTLLPGRLDIPFHCTVRVRGILWLTVAVPKAVLPVTVRV